MHIHIYEPHGNSQVFISICVLFNWNFTRGIKYNETSRQKSFGRNYAYNCVVNEDVPEGKKGEADEETKWTTFDKQITIVSSTVYRWCIWIIFSYNQNPSHPHLIQQIMYFYVESTIHQFGWVMIKNIKITIKITKVWDKGEKRINIELRLHLWLSLDYTEDQIRDFY